MVKCSSVAQGGLDKLIDTLNEFEKAAMVRLPPCPSVSVFLRLILTESGSLQEDYAESAKVKRSNGCGR